MTTGGPVAMPDKRDTRIRELEGLLAATREDLAQTRGLLQGTNANLGVMQGNLADTEAALARANEKCTGLDSSLRSLIDAMMLNRREFKAVLSLTRAAYELSVAGVKLRSRAVRSLLAAIETHARSGMGDDFEG